MSKTLLLGQSSCWRVGKISLPSQRSLGGHVPYLTILNVSGHCDLVRIEGGANAISLNAEGFTMVDLTIHGPRFHAIQVRGERGIPPTGIYNVHLLEADQQFIKTSTGDGTN